MAVWQFDDGEAHSHNEIPVFQIPMQWLEPGDLARYHQRFTLPLEILGLRVPASPPSPARPALGQPLRLNLTNRDRKSTRLNSSHGYISYAVFCLKKKKKKKLVQQTLTQHYIEPDVIVHRNARTP